MASDVQFRTLATAALARAKKLLEDESEASSIYACLEARMAIEALVYDLFQKYEKELSAGAMEKWTPKQVMAELLFIDDKVDQTSVLTIKRSGTEDIVFQGEDRRFRAKWADRSHNALSSFLHQPTLSQIRSPKGNRYDLARKRAQKDINELEIILRSPVFNSKIGQLVVFKCQCDREIARDVSFLEAKKPFSCFACGASYDYEQNENGSFTFKIQEVDYLCPQCSTKNVLPRHELGAGRKTSCCECGAEFTVRAIYTLEPSNSPPA